jgi:hypothetical protein
LTQQVHRRLRGAPPLLAGSVAGIVAVLRVDPTEASMIFRRRRLGDGGWIVTFGAAGGLLTYWVLPAERLVVLLDLAWAGLPTTPDGMPAAGGQGSNRRVIGTPSVVWLPPSMRLLRAWTTG